MKKGRTWVAVVMSVSFVLLGGCASQTRYHSSTVDYLFGNEGAKVEQTGRIVLSVPLKVGIGFVPEAATERKSGGLSRGYVWGSPFLGMHLTEKHKVELANEVVEHFQRYPFVGSIEIIPSAYLTPRGGFEDLDRLRKMFEYDAVVLLSYDQVQFTDQGFGSILYWTVVGAYAIQAEKNMTQTMMDAVVYDIGSRKMLFRAPGVSQIKGNATPVNLSEALRADSEKGFQEASKELIRSLDEQLALFRDKLKNAPEQYQLNYRRSYSFAPENGAAPR